MNVLYDHQIFFGQKYGGISRYFYEIAKKISKKENTVVDLFQGFNINQYKINKEDISGSYINYKRFLVPKTRIIYSMLNYLLLREKRRNKYNIYHPTYYSYYKTVKKEKMVITVHDMIHEIYYSLFRNDKTKMRKKAIIHQADGIIAVSQNTKKDLVNIYNVPENKIRVIYHGNSLNNIVDDKALCKEPYLLYVGNRDSYKNFMRALKAFARSKYRKDVLFVCFGGGDFTREEKDLIIKLNLSNRVRQYSGNDKILSNLYMYAKVFIYPSLYEGFGIPLLEAMHYKCPIIASKTSSIPEVLGDAGLYFDPISVEDICITIEKIFQDNSLRKKISLKGEIRGRNFSWDRCAEETFSFYKDVYWN